MAGLDNFSILPISKRSLLTKKYGKSSMLFLFFFLFSSDFSFPRTSIANESKNLYKLSFLTVLKLTDNLFMLLINLVVFNLNLAELYTHK